MFIIGKKEKNIGKTIDTDDARVDFGQLLDEIQGKDCTFIVQRRGKVADVMINHEDYVDMLEIQEELSDPAIKKAMKGLGDWSNPQPVFRTFS